MCFRAVLGICTCMCAHVRNYVSTLSMGVNIYTKCIYEGIVWLCATGTYASWQGTRVCLRVPLCSMWRCACVCVCTCWCWKCQCVSEKVRLCRQWKLLLDCADRRALAPYIHILHLYLCSLFVCQLVAMPSSWSQTVSSYIRNSHVFIKFQQILPSAIVLVALTGTCPLILYLQEKFITFGHIS